MENRSIFQKIREAFSMPKNPESSVSNERKVYLDELKNAVKTQGEVVTPIKKEILPRESDEEIHRDISAI